MSKIVLGKAGAIEQPKKYSGGPFKPDVTTRTWKGSKEAVLGQIAQAKAAGCEWSVEENGPNATIAITSVGSTLTSGGQDEIPVDTWELHPGIVEKDVLEADWPVVKAMTTDDKRLMRKLVENPDQVFATISFSSAAQAAGVGELFSAMAEGLRSAQIFTPVLTRSRSVSSSYAVVQAENNVGKVISTAALITSESVPASFLISFAKAPYTNSNPNAFKSYGWFKHPPTQRAASGSRTIIEQQWVFGLWVNIGYGAAL